MKSTRYFKEQVLRKRSYIKIHWLTKALKDPVRKERQPGGRFRYWVYIRKLNKYLRVVTLEDEKTIHNAFPDRNFKEVKL